jgi:hypothetical protein
MELVTVQRFRRRAEYAYEDEKVDSFFLDRPGNDAIQLDLLYDYQSNVGMYDTWHEYVRFKQPRMLIVWGMNDPFFIVEEAKAYQRDIPSAELHLIDTGHFPLEDSVDFIAERVKHSWRISGLQCSNPCVRNAWMTSLENITVVLAPRSLVTGIELERSDSGAQKERTRRGRRATQLVKR